MGQILDTACPKPRDAGILAGANRQKREENHAGKDAGAPKVCGRAVRYGETAVIRAAC